MQDQLSIFQSGPRRNRNVTSPALRAKEIAFRRYAESRVLVMNGAQEFPRGCIGLAALDRDRSLSRSRQDLINDTHMQAGRNKATS